MPSIRTRELQLHALGAETTTGAGSAIDVRDMARLVIYLFVTAVTGTSPTLDVVVQDSPDGTTWTNLASFTQVTGWRGPSPVPARASRSAAPPSREASREDAVTATVIHIISDATIKSGPAGEIRYTWSPESTWRQSLGANSVLTYIDVVTISSDAELKVQGQWSLDGKNWTDFGDDLESSVTAVGAQQTYYVGGVNAFEFGPYVRYGVSIAHRTSGTEESARCTVTVVVQS